VKAIKRPHFFAQPVNIPLVFRGEDAFGLTCGGATEVNNRQSGGSTPDAAELVDAGYFHDKLIFVLKSERIKQLIIKNLTRLLNKKFSLLKEFFVKLCE
jgi:hypothetical protein